MNFWESKLSTNQPPKRLWCNISQLDLANDQSHCSENFTADELNTKFSEVQLQDFEFHNDLQFCICNPDKSYNFHSASQDEVHVHRSILSIKKLEIWELL